MPVLTFAEVQRWAKFALGSEAYLHRAGCNFVLGVMVGPQNWWLVTARGRSILEAFLKLNEATLGYQNQARADRVRADLKEFSDAQRRPGA